LGTRNQWLSRLRSFLSRQVTFGKSALKALLGSYSMSGMKSSKALLQQKPPNEPRLGKTQEAARCIVRFLLDESPLTAALVSEASVHRPTRSRVWVATFTGPTGGQTWRSTGLTDRNQALLLAKRWEAEARVQRVAAGRTAAKPTLRVSRKEPGTGGPLTQKEVALLLNMSERGVREVERRAFQKLFNHPLLRQAWREYLAGELDEDQWNLTPEEIYALFKLARTAEEWLLLKKVARIIGA